MGIAAIQDLIVGDLVVLVLDESVRIEAKLKFKLRDLVVDVDYKTKVKMAVPKTGTQPADDPESFLSERSDPDRWVVHWEGAR